jgi:hypothetical protein
MESTPELSKEVRPSREKYKKINLSDVDRKKIKRNHGIETNEKIKIYDEIKHVRELWAFNSFPPSGSLRRCYWDHHTFEGIGIFCPISFRPKQVAKMGRSEVKDTDKISNFMVKENIPKCKDISTLNNLIEVTDAYYEVDGVFCSPECCLAFINDEKTKANGSKYNESERLLHFMLGLTFRLLPANHFRLLKEYGGNLTIEQFRNNNKSIKYEYCGTTVLISHLFEKKINLSTH